MAPIYIDLTYLTNRTGLTHLTDLTGTGRKVRKVVRVGRGYPFSVRSCRKHGPSFQGIANVRNADETKAS